MIIPIIFIVFHFVFISKSQITDSEFNVSVSLIKHLNAKNCIIISDSIDFSLLHQIRYLTFSQNIYTTYKNTEDLSDYATSKLDSLKRVKSPDLLLHKTVILWKTGIDQINQVLNKVNHFGRLKQFDWVIMLNEENVSNSHISKMKYGHYESNFLIVYPVGQNYEILEIYNIRTYYKTFIKFYGTWSNETGLKATDEYIFTRRFNLEQSPLMLHTYAIQVHTFQLFPVIRNLYEFWIEMGRIMNYSSVNFTKQHAQLLDPKLDRYQVTDAFLNFFAWNSLTANVINYKIVPLWSNKIRLHVKYESDAITDIHSLLKPFSEKIWQFLGVWLVVSTSLMLLTHYLLKNFLEHQLRNFTWIDGLFASFQTLLNQGLDYLPTLSCRILFASIIAKNLVLMPLYTGAVVSFLTVTNPYYPFKDLKGFLDDGTYKLVTLHNTFLSYYFEMADDPLSKEFYEKYLTKGTILPDLIDQISATCLEKKFAFLSINSEYLAIIKSVDSVRKCKILQIPEVLFTTLSEMLTNHDSSLTSVFKHNWLRFQNYGIANKMKKSMNPSTEEYAKDFRMINFSSVTPILTIVGIGMLLAGFFFLLEILYFYLKKLRKVRFFEDKKRSSKIVRPSFWQ